MWIKTKTRSTKPDYRKSLLRTSTEEQHKLLEPQPKTSKVQVVECSLERALGQKHEAQLQHMGTPTLMEVTKKMRKSISYLQKQPIVKFSVSANCSDLTNIGQDSTY